MNKCQNHCVFYKEEIHEINKKIIAKTTCDYKNGEEIKFSNEEIINCKHYKSYKDVPFKFSK